MDEVKRALETAEFIPYSHLIVHLGERTDGWSQRAIEYAETALEHLGAFARPLGVKLLVENLLNEAATPEHLMQILNVGHLNQVGTCLDLGHAHMTVGVQEAISAFGNRMVSMHVHDNHATKDEHLWPGEGTIDWNAVTTAVKAMATPPAVVLELSQRLPYEPTELPEKLAKAFALFD